MPASPKPRPGEAGPTGGRYGRLLCLVIGISACATSWLEPGFARLGQGLDGFLLVLATALTLFSLRQKLPAQNIAAATVLIALVAGVAASISPRTGFPFGKIDYAASLRLLGVLPWPVPLLWIVAILNAREVARLCLVPWRRKKLYGFWLTGLAAALVVVFDLSLEPFVVHARHYWGFPKMSPAGLGVPWVNSFGWFVLALALLFGLTPWLIKKRPDPEPKSSLFLTIWLWVNLYLTVGNAKQRLWAVVLISLLANGLIAVMATRGARLRQAWLLRSDERV